MTTTGPKHRFTRGQPIPAAWLNELVDTSVQQVMGGRGILVTRNGNHTTIALKKRVPRGRRIVDCVITNSQSFAANRWEYAATEVMWDANTIKWITKPNGMVFSFSEPCYNRFENHNDGSGAEGMGVELVQPSGATLVMQPIMAGVVIQLQILGNARHFEAVNAYAVSCTAGAQASPEPQASVIARLMNTIRGNQ